MDILLLDGPAIIHKSFWAVPVSMVNYQQEPINALVGTINTITALVTRLKPDFIVMAMEGGDNYRKALCPDYKATRKLMDPLLKNQLAVIEKTVKLMGIPIVRVPTFEADDIIASLVSHWAGEHEITIYTGDRDLLALVNNCTRVVLSGDGQTWDIEAIEAKYEIAPYQLTDWKALTGDSSDNIVGVPGIGPKAATKLIRQYKSFQALYHNVEDVRPVSLRQKLVEGRAAGVMSYSLVKMRGDVFPHRYNITIPECQPTELGYFMGSQGITGVSEIIRKWSAIKQKIAKIDYFIPLEYSVGVV